MKAIEQTSLALLSLSLLVLVLIAGVIALDRYTTHPPLYTPPPDRKDSSYVKTMREATSLEGLKQICTFWAEREDQTQRYVDTVYNQFTSAIRDVLTSVATLGVIFSAGLLFIYITARRLRRAQANAL